ncbi:MAG TPA: zf-HC2 domain-containing protein [Candidatus Binataceae bacterium]|nr:zf-HC2 domain-containing protein [Candidatus Binataceae bacterium]
MDCQEYIDEYLSAHADEELSAREQGLAEEHLGGCAGCRQQLAEERALKAVIHRDIGLVKTPADVRLRIRAALGENSEHIPSVRAASTNRSLFSRRGADGERAFRVRISERIAHAQHLAPIAFVLVVLVASVAIFAGKSSRVRPVYERPVSAFDFAIAKFDQMSEGFSPNVPAEAFSREGGAYFAWVEESDPVHHVSDELPDISSSYEKIQMPPESCDFSIAGYRLDGGRIEHLPDGRPVTYTLYHDRDNSILSVSLKQRMSAPEGAVYWFETHALYSYKGYSICLTSYPIGHFVSIIVTRAPMIELLHDVAVADIAFLAQ